MSIENPDWPVWPPVPEPKGINGLGKYGFIVKPQDAWTIDEWKLYSEFLIEQGAILKQSLHYAMILVADKTLKSCRGKEAKVDTSILDRLFNKQPKGFGLRVPIKKHTNRGRKPGGKHDKAIDAAFALQEAAKANGQKLTDIEAARQVIADTEPANWKLKRDAATIAKRMSEKRKNPNNSKS